MIKSKKEWEKLKGKIKSKFSKLSDTDIESLNGHMEKLQEKVQKTYSYTRDKAIQECDSFNKTIVG